MGMPTGTEGGNGPELKNDEVDQLSKFVASLPLPKSRDKLIQPLAFASAQCGLCHVPRMPATGGSTVSIFSDLLLHDMGEGLTGAAPDGNASASEWRTAPLIDLDPRGGKRRYLHDGRAASVEEAILWHGGEAKHARDLFGALSAGDKAALLRYLESL